MRHRLSSLRILRFAPRPWSGFIIIVCLAGLSTVLSSQESERPLTSGHIVQGLITTDNPNTYTFDLRKGDFVRVIGTCTPQALLRLIGPSGDTLQNTYVSLYGDSLPLMLSHVAAIDGLHRLEVLRWPGDTSIVRYNLGVDEWLSRAQYKDRLDSLRMDPRVLWLDQHVLPLSSLSLEDDNFSDLKPLRKQIGNARIVLLGEESHASGTTIRAMSRLVQFLHEEMGFDVLAFEASMFAMWQVGEFLRARQDPIDAFKQGLIGTWSQSPDFEPLARYLGEHAVGPHSLEVAGVDTRFEPLDRKSLIPQLHKAASGIGLGVEGLDVVPAFWTTLSDFMAGYYFQPDSIPSRRVQEDVVADLRWLAERFADSIITRSGDDPRTFRLWAQVSRSLAELITNVWHDPSGDSPSFSERRDQQMARNLVWLAREYFPNRKIIVWAHNGHVLRHTFRIYPSQDMDCDCGMGQRIWEVFGEASFVIAATAYEGRYMWRAMGPELPDLTVVTDQDARFELEELLAATALQNGVLILKTPAPGGEWLRTPILSRIPNNYYSKLSIWPDHTDAVLFLRTIEPRRTPPARR